MFTIGAKVRFYAEVENSTGEWGNVERIGTLVDYRTGTHSGKKMWSVEEENRLVHVRYEDELILID